MRRPASQTLSPPQNAGTSKSGRYRRGDLRLVRHFHPRHRKDEEHCVETEAHRDSGEESAEAEAEPVDRREPAGDICRKASCIGACSRGAASETLRDEEQGETKPEADV